MCIKFILFYFNNASDKLRCAAKHEAEKTLDDWLKEHPGWEKDAWGRWRNYKEEENLVKKVIGLEEFKEVNESFNELKELKEKRKTYSEMVDFCCGDQIILNNYIVEFMAKNDYYEYEIVCGSDRTFYDDNGDETEEETDNYDYDDIFQYYIIFFRVCKAI